MHVDAEQVRFQGQSGHRINRHDPDRNFLPYMRDGSLEQRGRWVGGLSIYLRGSQTPKVMTQTRPHSPCRDRNTLRTSIPTKRPTECAPLAAPPCTQTSLGTWLEPTGRSRRRAKVMQRNSTFYLNWLVGGRSRIRTYDPLIKSQRLSDGAPSSLKKIGWRPGGDSTSVLSRRPRKKVSKILQFQMLKLVAGVGFEPTTFRL